MGGDPSRRSAIANQRTSMATPTRKSVPRGRASDEDSADKGTVPTARALTEKALRVLGDGMDGEDMRIALACAKEVISNGKTLGMVGDLSQRLDGLDDETLDAAINAIRQALGAAQGVGGGTREEEPQQPSAPLPAVCEAGRVSRRRRAVS
jgi:hypothetical protein